ncbi:MAG: tRNA preQ1(34) S-adenosylmethionine ribosyltransferase-isomerase QueA [Bdellovibrionales bacterium]|nr:tRNA preQ1(34) S-adenosylmethionine ribosyltransferase-isomerase QueA [Bdellovibrionales bacterium]
MLTSDLDYTYPESLVATKPQNPSRIMLAGSKPKEVTKSDLFMLFQPGDILVVNETKVIPKKIKATTAKNKPIEILFLDETSENVWSVLLPLSRLQKGEVLSLPEGLELVVIEGGIPQKASVSKKMDANYFITHGQMPLPPYIEKARKLDPIENDDMNWYQTAWAKTAGSAAAPTASFHFTESDLEDFKKRGVNVEKICLHVGLGTFLPVQAEDLTKHKMHSEYAEVKLATWKSISECKGRVWALGTTVCRTLESIPAEKLSLEGDSYKGNTDIFIYPGHSFKVVTGLLTNFHQPKSTLLALVAAFSDLDTVKKNYAWAIENKFRLFSYGDLSVWLND